MTLKDEMTGDKKLVYGKYGKFECTAYLERPFKTTTRLVGMTLEFRILQDRNIKMDA